VLLKFTDVSEKCTASIFRVEEAVLFDFEVGDNTFL
jgi:hypothetical protein